MNDIKKLIEHKNTTVLLAVVLLALVIGFLYLFINKHNAEINKAAHVAGEVASTEESQIAKLKDKTVTEPNNPDAWRNLGRAEYLSGDAEAAAGSLSKALALDSSNPQFYVDLGNAYEAGGDNVKAEENYKKAVELNNKEIVLNNNEGLKITSAATGAIEGLARLTNQPKQYYHLVTPYTALGNLYLKLNKPDEAIKILESGVAMNPKYPDFYFYLSKAYLMKGDKSKAAEFDNKFKRL